MVGVDKKCVWEKLQSLLNVTTPKHKEDATIRLWNNHGFGGTAEYVTSIGTFKYRRVYKCANDAIRFNLARWPSGARSKRTCTFTFLRNPIERFASAVNEFEHRLGKHSVHSQQLKQAGMRIADFPVGAPNRTSAFIKDIVEGNWISNRRVNPKINPNVAFEHLFPQANALRTNRSSLDFVGQVHNLQKDWHTMQQVCGVPSKSRRTFDSNVGRHPSGKDPKGVKAGSLGFIRKNTAAHLSVCLLYVRDYVEIHTSPKGLPASCSKYVKDCLTR